MFDFASRILLEDDGLIAWDKPPHLPSTGRNLDDPDCAQHLAMTHYRRMIWAVHQLDAETSGLLLFVRRKSLVPHWQQILTSPSTTKEYLAIVHGVPVLPPNSDTLLIEAPIDRIDGAQGFRMGVTSTGKYARTDLKLLDHTEDTSLLSLRIHTGRTHQIRVHLEHIGLSLIGEQRYRPTPCDLHTRHALHAHRIYSTASLPDLHAPFPPDLVALAARHGLKTDPVSP